MTLSFSILWMPKASGFSYKSWYMKSARSRGLGIRGSKFRTSVSEQNMDISPEELRPKGGIPRGQVCNTKCNMK